MAQLSDDCFAFGGALMSVEDAQALIAARVPAADGAETVALGAARGRVLAQDLVAPIPLPPFFNAAVDGWAFRHADLDGNAPTRLRESGRVPAGHTAAQPARAGEALRVFTGAPMPPGTDTCVMQEDVQRDGETVLVPPGLKRGANARPAGEDVALGSVALAAGRVLGPAEIGLAAALGQARLPVRPLPRVGVFSTGDELAPPGAPLRAAQTHDSNRFTLLALLAGLPCVASDLGILPDDPARTAAALAAAARDHDLLLTSGGVSTGEEDHVRAAIESGGSLVFWRLAVKPGRPAAMGVLPKAGGDFRAGGTPVVGLPGNPVAAVVCFLHLARPLLLRLAGAADRPLPRYGAVAGFDYRKKAGRREYVRVTLHTDGAVTRAEKFPREGAGLLSSLTQSDGFAELPEEVTRVAPGDAVTVLPFAGML
jgi:molybdopterin molybdotransferase